MQTRTNKKRTLKPTEEEKKKFNEAFNKHLDFTPDETDLQEHDKLDFAFYKAAEEIPEADPKIKKPWITDNTFRLIKQKHWVEQSADWEEYKKKATEVRKHVRWDWRNWLKTITEEADLAC